MSTLTEDNFNALKYESTEYKEKMNNILNQISTLNQDYYECMHDWVESLRGFIAKFPTNYYRINDNVYVRKKSFESGVMRRGNGERIQLPITWTRFEGIVVYNGKDTINDSFGVSFSVKPDDVIEPIDNNVFNEVFYSVCNKVFANTEENIKLQYDDFPFGFYRMLEDYSEIFPETAHKFNEKLEIMFDEDE